MSADSADAPPPPPPPPPPPDYSVADQPVVDEGHAAPDNESSLSADATGLGADIADATGGGTPDRPDGLAPADVPMVDEGQTPPDLISNTAAESPPDAASQTDTTYGAETRRDIAAEHPDLYSKVDSPPPRVDGPHESPEGWAADINPGNGKDNCGDCARAVQDTWEGDPRTAAVGGPEDGRLMTDWAGADPEPVSTDGINDKLTELGSGSSAVVRCEWDGGGGHYINAVNDGGSIKAVDGQSGDTEGWPPTESGLGFSPADMQNVHAVFFDASGKVVR